MPGSRHRRATLARPFRAINGLDLVRSYFMLALHPQQQPNFILAQNK